MIPSRNTKKEMQADEADQQRGNHEYMQREKSRQSFAGDDRSAENQIDDLEADDRSAARDRRADAESPVCVLIEAQHLAGERHPERAQKQDASSDPGELARKFVRAEQKHLDQVDEHQGDHEVGAPAVQRAQIPSERLLVVQIDQAVPGAIGGWSIDSREADAGDYLQNEYDQRRAAEDVPPARGAARHGMLGDFGDRLTELQTRVEPSAEALSRSIMLLARPASATGRRKSKACRPRLCICIDTARAAEVPKRACRRSRIRRRGMGT